MTPLTHCATLTGIYIPVLRLASLREELERSARQGLCRLVRATDPFADFVSRSRGNPSGLGLGAGIIDRAREGIERFACDNAGSPGSPGGPGDDFGGSAPPGQCQAVYRLRANITYNPPDGSPTRTELFGANDTNTYPGPIGADSGLASSGNQFTVEFANIPGRIIGPFFIGPLPTYSLALERVDGNPDLCLPDGSPFPTDPETGEPITPNPRAGDDVFPDDPDGGPIVPFPVGIVYSPIIISPSFEPEIGITFEAPDFNLYALYNVFNNDFNFNLGGVEIGGGCCELPPEEGGDDEEPNEEERLIAVRVESTVSDPPVNLTEVFNPTGPSLWVPDLGRVVFYVKGSNGNEYLPPVPYNLSPARVLVPAGAEVLGYTVIPRPGVTVTNRPIYAILNVDE